MQHSNEANHASMMFDDILPKEQFCGLLWEYKIGIKRYKCTKKGQSYVIQLTNTRIKELKPTDFVLLHPQFIILEVKSHKCPVAYHPTDEMTHHIWLIQRRLLKTLQVYQTALDKTVDEGH